MKLSDISNLIPHETVPTENPVRNMIRQKRGNDFKTALTVALKDKKAGNPTKNTDPHVKAGGVEDDGGTVAI